MCRFVAYIGQEPVLLHGIIGKQENSLIKQSHSAIEGKTGVNGDGFGVGWYNREIQKKPAIFKSIQPAWNDENLLSLTSVVKSNCLLGHVRASTIGGLGFSNCHPFSYDNMLFVHNGTINGFPKIKRKIVNRLSDKVYFNIKGQTDSEHFFSLVVDILFTLPRKNHVESMMCAVKEAIDTIKDLQKEVMGKISYKLNIALTNGESLLLLRSSSPNISKPLSLYLHRNTKKTQTTSESPYFLISSEKLWGNDSKESSWDEIPPDHFFLIDKHLNGKLVPL